MASDRGPLHVVQSGRGPAVVLVHGVAGSHRSFDPIVPLLEDDFTVVRVDLRVRPLVQTPRRVRRSSNRSAA